MTIPGFVIQMSGSQVPIVPPPAIGADNDYVYRQLLGISDDAVEALRREGTI